MYSLSFSHSLSPLSFSLYHFLSFSLFLFYKSYCRITNFFFKIITCYYSLFFFFALL